MAELQLPYQTPLDDTLVHQVRFSSSHNVVQISCVCRNRTGRHEKHGKLYADPIGPTKDIEESRRLYNDPANHWAPFADEDKAKW